MAEWAPNRWMQDLSTFEEVDSDCFAVQQEGDGSPEFGGAILARAAAALSRTAQGKRLHSLHARFLRPVPDDARLVLRVERVKEGRLVAVRRVGIHLDGASGKLLFEASASFCSEAPGRDYQEAAAPAGLPDPETLPSEEERARKVGLLDWTAGDFEWRWPGEPAAAADASTWHCWARPLQPLPDDPGVHAAALALLSDVHSDWAVSRKVGGHWPRDRFASLDHALWLHRPLRWDDWLVIESRSDVAQASRALTHRRVYTRDGALVASIVQEALLLDPKA